jgi:glucose-1-phosphate thymidylyltransferase
MVKTSIILAGGYGTRLGKITKNFPKPLLEIAPSKPIINYIITKLESTEIKKVYVITNNKFFNNFITWKNTLNSNLDIEIINNGTNSLEERLGPVGEINFVINLKKLKEPLLIIGGDNLFKFELTPILNYFKKHNKDLTVLSEETDIEKLKQLCSIKLDSNNKITFFEEKPPNPSSTLFGICMYLYTAETVEIIKQYMDENNDPDKSGNFLQWLYTKKEVHGFKAEGKWIDIGDPKSLEEARKEF